MNRTLSRVLLAALPILAGCGQKPSLSLSLPEKFEGKTVELVNYLDSTVISSSEVTDGNARFVLSDSVETPVFTTVNIDGRIRAFYVAEPGQAVAGDSVKAASGTPLNDRFRRLLISLDSIENLDDMDAYLKFVGDTYQENKDNPIGSYFGIEWIKYASLSQADSLLADAAPELRESPKAAHYINFARLRDNTSPGRKYTDFPGKDEAGKEVTFSGFVKPGRYTLVDFWASWCPYCIKELPELKSLYENWHDRGLDIVGVAVRDLPDDTRNAVKKHNIPWSVMYDTQRGPYDIYGFSGIPHHMLIGPDGTIVSRGASAAQIGKTLEEALAPEAE